MALAIATEAYGLVIHRRAGEPSGSRRCNGRDRSAVESTADSSGAANGSFSSRSGDWAMRCSWEDRASHADRSSSSRYGGSRYTVRPIGRISRPCSRPAKWKRSAKRSGDRGPSSENRVFTCERLRDPQAQREHAATSVIGTFEACHRTPRTSAYRGRPEVVSAPSERRD